MPNRSEFPFQNTSQAPTPGNTSLAPGSMKIPDDAALFLVNPCKYDAPKAGPADTPDTLSDNTLQS